MAQVSINADHGEWSLSTDAGERARLLQSPCVDTAPKSEREASSGDLGRGTTSTLGAVFIVVNACLGAGLLNFPAAFSTAGGVAAGVTLQMGMLVFIISGLVILAYCSQASNERTYQEVVWAVCGKLTGVLCEVAIATYTFGTCIAFLIIIGDQQDKIIAVMAKEPEGAHGSPWYADRKFTISLTAFLFILPLSIPREIGFQKYASFLSVVGTWYVTAIIIIKYIWPDKEMTPGDILTRPASWIAVFNAMPTICFGFQCHVSSVPVFNSMRQPEVKTWGGVVTAAMVIALAVYMGTGECSPPRAGVGVLPLFLIVPKSSGPAFLGTALHSQHLKHSVGIGFTLGCRAPPPAQTRELCPSIHSAALNWCLVSARNCSQHGGSRGDGRTWSRPHRIDGLERQSYKSKPGVRKGFRHADGSRGPHCSTSEDTARNRRGK
uniref:Sodium-coupled neutral amino acid transporter 7 n=1 Tax=Equus caballus TaxID=9796 RepID=A0A3Q2L4H9_HORSE